MVTKNKVLKLILTYGDFRSGHKYFHRVIVFCNEFKAKTACFFSRFFISLLFLI